MARPPSGNRQTILLNLSDRHKEILRRLTLGETPQQVAESLKISIGTVSRIRNSPCGIEYITALQASRDRSTEDTLATVGEMLDINALTAVNVLVACVKGDLKADRKGYLRLKASQDLLDRAGYPKVSRLQKEDRTAPVNAQVLSEIEEQVKRYRMEGRAPVAHADEEKEG